MNVEYPKDQPGGFLITSPPRTGKRNHQYKDLPAFLIDLPQDRLELYESYGAKVIVPFFVKKYIHVIRNFVSTGHHITLEDAKQEMLIAAWAATVTWDPENKSKYESWVGLHIQQRMSHFISKWKSKKGQQQLRTQSIDATDDGSTLEVIDRSSAVQTDTREAAAQVVHSVLKNLYKNSNNNQIKWTHIEIVKMLYGIDNKELQPIEVSRKLKKSRYLINRIRDKVLKAFQAQAERQGVSLEELKNGLGYQ